MSLALEPALDVAKRAADAAGQAALSFFEGKWDKEEKPDGSFVTAADKAAEAAALSIIRAAFPTHRILSEESGESPGEPQHRWIVDPLDGTHRFMRGLPYWGPLIALERDGVQVVGAAAMPVSSDIFFAARGLGSYHNDSRCRVAATSSLSQALLSVGELPRLLAAPFASGVVAMIKDSHGSRCFGDVGAVALVLTGKADAYIEAGVQLWDLAAHQVLIEEAGGVFTDFTGKRTAASGNCIAANPALHAELLRYATRSGS